MLFCEIKILKVDRDCQSKPIKTDLSNQSSQSKPINRKKHKYSIDLDNRNFRLIWYLLKLLNIIEHYVIANLIDQNRWILDDIICLHSVSNYLLRWAKMSSLHCNSFQITTESQCNVLIWAGNLKQNVNKWCHLIH